MMACAHSVVVYDGLGFASLGSPRPVQSCFADLSLTPGFDEGVAERGHEGRLSASLRSEATTPAGRQAHLIAKSADLLVLRLVPQELRIAPK